MMKSMSLLLLCTALLSSNNNNSLVVAFQSALTATASATLPSLAAPASFSSRSSALYQVAALVDTVTTINTCTDTATTSTTNPWDRVRSSVSGTTSHLSGLRQKIAKSGVATALSYSAVSNVFTSVAVSLAWYGFSLQTGLSPLASGQWKPFLALYAGFYAVNSLLKPIRFVVALSVVKHTEVLLQSLQDMPLLGDSRKAAIGCSTALLVTTSSAIMATGIGLASVSSGIPIL